MSARDERTLAVRHEELAGLVGEVVEQGGCLRFRAEGRSMWPFLRGGDGLVVEPVSTRNARVGDVLLYRTSHGGVVAHRLVGRSGGRLRTRGDRVRAPAEWIGPGQVLGRVGAVERAGRHIDLDRPLRRLPALAWIALRPGLRLAARGLGLVARALGGRRPSPPGAALPG